MSCIKNITMFFGFNFNLAAIFYFQLLTDNIGKNNSLNIFSFKNND
jgi:hypothetical protein